MLENGMVVTRSIYHGLLDDNAEYDNSFALKVFEEFPAAFDKFRKYYPDTDIELPEKLGAVDITYFANKEPFAESRNSVQGKTVFYIHEFRGYDGEFDPNVGQIAQLAAVDALHRAGAEKVIIVLPFQPFQRSELKAKPRTPITAAVIAKMTQMFTNRLITADMHAGALEGFYNIPVSNLKAMPLFAKYYIEQNVNYLPGTADAGGTTKAEEMGELLDSHEVAIITKKTIGKNKKKTTRLSGDVEGQNIVIIEDMIDTAGTLEEAAKLYKDNGAKSIEACATHPICSNYLEENGDIRKSADRIMDSEIDKVRVMDTIDLGEDFFDKYGDKFVPMTMTPVFANVMTRLHACSSVSNYLNEYYGLFDEDV